MKQNQYFKFLRSRNGASDSDVDALMVEFGLSLMAAAEIYRDWLDTLWQAGEEAA